MNQELLTKLEKASRDRDFFILNKDAIEKSCLYLEDILSKYIDICCMKFKTFSVNKTAFIYGSIVTLGAAFVLSNEIHFKNARGNALEYLIRDIFPLFVEEYNTTTLVSDKTQLHMLKGCVEEYKNLHNGTLKYLGGEFDQYFDKDFSGFKKYYLNEILKYCAEHRCEGNNNKEIANELLPLLSKLF